MAVGSLRECCFPTAVYTTLSAALVIKFGGRFSAWMLLEDSGVDNTSGICDHQVWRGASCGYAAGRGRPLYRIWLPSLLSFATGSLWRCHWPIAAHMTHLLALVTEFEGGLPAKMLLAKGDADNAFGGPRHQVWRQAPGWDVVGRRGRRQRLWRPWSPRLVARSMQGCC